MDKTNKVVIVGESCAGRSRAFEHILAERGLTADDIVVVSLKEMGDAKKALEFIENVPKGKVIFIENINLLLSPPHKTFPSKEGMLMKINNTLDRDELKAVDITSINKHPFDKFITKRGKKW